LDSEGKGRVSVQDVRDALQDGSERAAVLLQQLAPLHDEDTLTLTEFTSLVTKRYDDGGDADDMTRMFRLFDKDKKGYIELKDLKRIAAELGENMTDAELREMVDRGSNQARGKVTLEEFTTIMNKKLWT
jgi:Ca2+-binding EF-hand superfamily protein